MRKKFNDTGLCIPGRHYMADTSRKIEQIIRFVEEGEYFTINRPRQFGKTTILSLLAKQLNQRDDYLALKISFEEIDSDTYQDQERFIYEFLMMLLKKTEFLKFEKLSGFIEQYIGKTPSIPALSRFITRLVQQTEPNKSLVLLIDEVDKSANNRLFLNFLGMLRNKYLQRNEGEDHTFQSVILAGVHDVKTLKVKIRPDDERKYNSPWNIAMDFTVDLGFSPDEIVTMLQEYSHDKGIHPDNPTIAERLCYYTSGYPYLVSKLCKFIDERIAPSREDKNWSVGDVDEAFRLIVNEGYTTTLFDSLTKNLENNGDLYDAVLNMVINGKTLTFAISDPVICQGHLYGILAIADDGRCRIHNRIYEQRIYAYMMSKLVRTQYEEINDMAGPEFFHDDILDVELILQRFQAFMKEHHSHKDQRFLEREGRLLFLSFLRPIINGKGFEFKEPSVADERRMDIVITYKNRRYVVELKRWYGHKAHQEGLKQLSDYLDMYSLKQGYLLIYDFSKNIKYRQEEILFQDKRIFTIVVAAEIRDLAKNTRIAAQDINSLSMANLGIAEKTGLLLEEMVAGIQKTADLVQDISSSGAEQATGIEEVNKAMQQLDMIIQQNAASTEEMAASSQEFSSQAERLRETASFFEISEEMREQLREGVDQTVTEVQKMFTDIVEAMPESAREMFIKHIRPVSETDEKKADPSEPDAREIVEDTEKKKIGKEEKTAAYIAGKKQSGGSIDMQDFDDSEFEAY